MAKRAAKRKVLVVTGTRAEFGLLLPVMRAIQKTKKLSLHVVATGSHLLPPARTVREVKAAFPKTITVPMQQAGKTGRTNDAVATGRGIEGLTHVFARVKPDWVVVLGDRIEAFAAASAASIAGIAVCHIHGGDRAEGIADEAMRHAITKLSHLHCAATEQSRGRIVKMGERPEHVFNTGSPAIDGLDRIQAMGDAEVGRLGVSSVGKRPVPPASVLLLHPSGLPREKAEWHDEQVFFATFLAADPALHETVLCFAPNHDAGREHIEQCRRLYRHDHGWRLIEHLERPRFLALLKWMAVRRVPLIGNSSAGLIECSALGVGVINVGPRQNGRERGPNVHDVPDTGRGFLDLVELVRTKATRRSKLFGDGRTGPRIAALLAKLDPHDPALLRKRNAY